MLRHEFRPGRLVAGAAFTLAGIVYAGDAGGLWETPWFAVIPMVMGGLCLAGATGVLTQSIRRRRGPRRGAPVEAGGETAS
ncbi:hypothetical protein [Streptomyces aurantiogriseus]|uniref:Uncharacterized protein n=1 Tax=Streptomyces aurantiogriseus TaxID=66870 RepID=A0A918C2A2_9ACTN|nr:hypothetical protein [Streptomyces aurantiogriseus]GGR00364.1 hypothetical protein GCM10010251_14670 [Streptomyces aurantiogriseus]